MGNPTRAQLMDALRKADAAGDTEAAKRFAERIKALPSEGTRAGRPAGTPRKERGWKDYLSMGGRMLGDIAAETADFAEQINPIAKITNTVARKLGGTATTNAELATKLADRAGLEAPTEDERLGYETTKGAVSALIPIPGAGKVKAGARALDAVGGALAGGGSEFARQQGAPGWLQTVIGLGGGVAPAAVATGARHVPGAALEFVGTKGAETRAARLAQRRAGGRVAAREAAQNIEQAPAPSPGVQPTMAETARNRGLAALQRESNVDDIEARLASNAQARVANIGETAGPGAPQAVQDLALAEQQAGADALARRQRTAEAQTQQAIAEGNTAMEQQLATSAQERLGMEEAAAAERAALEASNEEAMLARTGEIGPFQGRTESAKPLREKFTAAYKAARDKTNAAYNARTLKRPTKIKMTTEQTEDLYDSILDQVDSHYGNLRGEPPREVSKAVREVFEEIQGKTLNTSMIANVDSRLADLAGSRRVQGLASEAKFIEDMRRVLGDATDPHVPPRFKAALEKAKALRREQGSLFEQELGSAFGKDRFGNFTTKDPALVRSVITAGDDGAVMGEQLINALGRKDATDAVEREFRRMAEEGLLETRAQLRQVQPVLDLFPDLKDRVNAMRGQAATGKEALTAQAAATKKALAEQQARAGAAKESTRVAAREKVSQAKAAGSKYVSEQEALNKTFSESSLGRMAKDRQTPHQHVQALLNEATDSRVMDELYKQVGHDPDAVAGVRRAMAENIMGAGPSKGKFGPNQDRIPNTADTLVEIDKVLTRGGKFLTKEQTEALTVLKREMEDAEFAKTGGVKQQPEDISHGAIPTKGAWSARLIRFALQHFTNQNQVDEFIKRAVLEPDFAATILKRATVDRKKEITRTLRRGALAGARGAGMPQAQPEPEPELEPEY